MVRFDARIRVVAACLSAVAGYVDAIGFLSLRGFFVSFMSGNSTQAATFLATAHWRHAAAAIGLIILFVSGVVLGSLVGQRAGRNRRPAVLALIAVLLAMSSLCGVEGWPHCAIIAATVAMGAENAVFERDGEIIGLTYMTGTLVKLGQRLALTCLGEDRWSWLPYLISWSALVIGAILGAFAYPVLGLVAMAFAAIVTAVLTIISLRLHDQGSDYQRP